MNLKIKTKQKQELKIIHKKNKDQMKYIKLIKQIHFISVKTSICSETSIPGNFYTR